MKFYLAPLEGITGYIFRNAIHEYYDEGVDKYFTPFITPHTKCSFNAKERKDIIPENNQGRTTVVQVLTNKSEDFLSVSKDIMDFGYDEININIGCPSGTVASKNKGAGFLKMPDKVDEFLEEVFTGKPSDLKVSVKTRIGVNDPEEFYQILDIYNKYPLEELIIHPRILKEYYKGKPHRDIFSYAMKNSKNAIIFNGDINSVQDYIGLIEELGISDNFKGVMFGRGMLGNPALISEVSNYEKTGTLPGDYDWERFVKYHARLRDDFVTTVSGDMNVLYKMKEIWPYMINLFPDGDKEMKNIRKSKHLPEYNAAVNALLRQVGR